MEIKANIKYVKTPAKKLRFLLEDIKKQTPVGALNTLFYSKRRSSALLYKAIKSAVDNAKNTFKIDENLLKFKTLVVEMGPALKRFKAGSRGTAKPFRRKTSHIKVVLEVIEPKQEIKKVEKLESPKVEKTEVAKPVKKVTKTTK